MGDPRKPIPAPDPDSAALPPLEVPVKPVDPRTEEPDGGSGDPDGCENTGGCPPEPEPVPDWPDLPEPPPSGPDDPPDPPTQRDAWIDRILRGWYQ